MPLRRLRGFLLVILAGISLTLVAGCARESGFTLWIGATMWGYSEDTRPEGLATAVVWLWNDTAWAPVPNADVTVNGIPLDYVPNSDVYIGVVNPVPGEDVHLEVRVMGKTYAALGTMFAGYPAFTDPVPGTIWEAGEDQHIFWTGCEPEENAAWQWIAVLDAGEPLGEAVFPTTYLPVISREHTFGARSISAGERLLTVNIGSQHEIPDATWDSLMLIWSGTTVPITVRGRYMSISPLEKRVPLGGDVDFTARTHSYYTGTTTNVTAESDWSTSNPDVATVDAAGHAVPVGEGTAVVTAGWEDLSVSAELTVLPWTEGPNGIGDYIYDMEASDNLLVAVGRDGIIYTSVNGTEWTLQTSGVDKHLNDIIWTGVQFVAVGNNGTVLTSSDGIEWTNQVSGIATGLTGIAWSGANFVAVGSDGIFSSPDAATWTVRRDITQLWSDVACSDSEFVAVGALGALYSTDEGVTWNSCDGISGSKSFVSWTGDCYVAGGSGGSAYSSQDGISWTATSLTDIYRLNDCDGNGTGYVMIGSRASGLTPLVMFSEDAETWDVQTLECSGVSHIEWFDGVYVALGYNTYVLISTPATSQPAARTSWSSEEISEPVYSLIDRDWLRSLPGKR